MGSPKDLIETGATWFFLELEMNSELTTFADVANIQNYLGE